MSAAAAELTINKSADEVWEHIRDFGDISWHGGVATCTVQGDVRTATMEGIDGLEIDERLLHHDDDARTYTYSVTKFRGPTTIDLGNGDTFDLASMAGHHRATVTVTPAGASMSLVTYGLELDPGHDSTLDSTIGGYQQKLEHLKGALGG